MYEVCYRIAFSDSNFFIDRKTKLLFELLKQSLLLPKTIMILCYVGNGLVGMTIIVYYLSCKETKLPIAYVNMYVLTSRAGKDFFS